MNDVGLDGSVERGAVGNGSRPGYLGISAGGRLLDGFSEGLEPSLGGLVTGRVADGFAGGFDRGLSVGHRS